MWRIGEHLNIVLVGHSAGPSEPIHVNYWVLVKTIGPNGCLIFGIQFAVFALAHKNAESQTAASIYQNMNEFIEFWLSIARPVENKWSTNSNHGLS